jgi:phage host-nuclease inhibitor protein Gam
LTLNSILEEANAALEKEKEDLLRRVGRLEAVVDSQETRRHIDNQYKLRIEEMHDEIEMLKESLKETERKLHKAEGKLK